MHTAKDNHVRISRLSKASWFKLEVGDLIIHFDPGYAGYFSTQGIPLAELEQKADLVLISHFHKDHLQPDALAMIVDAGTVIIAPESCLERIPSPGLKIKPGETLEIRGCRITAVDAYNTSEAHSTRKVHHKGDFVGYLLEVGGKVLYFAGDTDLIPEMKTLGAVDVAFLPIGGTFVMDLDEALEAACVIAPKIVIPMHHAKADMKDFQARLASEDLQRSVVLQTGESVVL